MDAHPRGSLPSRALHRLEALSQSTAAAATALLTSAGFLVAALVAPDPVDVLTVFEALAAAVTLLMVFALQHTQARQQAAVQRKLDEVLRSLPASDKRLVQAETASQSELEEHAEHHADVRAEAVSRGAPGTGARVRG